MSSAKIGVVMGGLHERERSLDAGESVLRALLDEGRDAVPVVLDRGFDAARTLQTSTIDVAFLALQGRADAGGSVQGLLEVMGVPFTGSSVLATALAADQLKMKELFRLHNLPTPPYYVCERSEADALRDVHGSFGFPVVVKPRRTGAAAPAKAENFGELATAVARAHDCDGSAIVERFVAATEVHVGLFQGRVLGAIEAAPGRLSPTRYRGLMNLGERAAEALDASSAVLVDVLVTEGQNEYVLGVHTLPDLHPDGVFARIAKAAGFGFPALCAAIADSARLHAAESAPPKIVKAIAAPALDETRTAQVA